MIGRSYIITRDYGFAPNPFDGVCTLATCKPEIRRLSQIGDWVIATGSAGHDASGRLVCLMEVNEILTYTSYWDDPRFQSKKPIMNGSQKQLYGDNIYHQQETQWIHVNSHHSNADGSVNTHNRDRDTKCLNVLISNNFYYFGQHPVFVPRQIANQVTHTGVGHRNVEERPLRELIDFIGKKYPTGIIDFPRQFDTFERYDGVS